MKGVFFLITVLIICLRSSFCSLRNQPRAVTENGVVVGRYATSHYGKIFQSFQGIPYAKPPVDDNRFKEPERLDNIWIGEWNATAPGSPCLQYDHYTRHRDHNGDLAFHVIGDEDCLFLNVYTQEGGPPNKEVIVLIHGGAFMFGSGTGYGPEYLMERDDIVLVTFNYRLGPLGFLSTGDYFVPGNNGLKDQVAVLEWVQRNIAGFGGDPNKVTLIGLSAGGASVHYHFLSPMSYGLFKRGYSYSGTALCPWALVRDGPQKTRQLASFLGCPTSDSRTIVKCLRRRPARKIVEQVKNFHTWMYNPFTVFGPVVETGANRPFLDHNPRELLRAGRIKDLPWIVGVTSEEGLYPAADFVDNDRYLQQLSERWHSLAPSLLFYSDRYQTNIAEKMKQVYLNNQDLARTNVNKIIKMVGDRLFVAPAVEASILQAQRNNAPVYMYQYRYQGERSVSQLLSMSNVTYGVCHGDDMAYIIKFYGFNTHLNINDKAMADFLGNILFTYAKTGRPPMSLGWEPVPRQPSDKATYLSIITPNHVEMKNDELGNLRILSEIFGHDSMFRDEL